jgi:hypothetical protein
VAGRHRYAMFDEMAIYTGHKNMYNSKTKQTSQICVLVN